MEFNGRTPDIAEENRKALFQLFPEVCKDGEVDPVALQRLFGKIADDGEEGYSFTWHGKAAALRNSQDPSCGTLRPCPDESESKDWDTTKNIYIEGDNLEVLKLLQKSYFGKIKMIYIDPPYNTGKEFVYPDDYKDSIKNYLKITGQIDSEGNKLTTNTEANGRFHTDWLNMMYPRLRLARNLLSEDGIIFISIDDYEIANLRKICDEIFYKENLLMDVIWDLGTGTSAGHFTRSHEYILVYAKNKAMLPNFNAITDDDIVERATKKISKANPASEITFPAGMEFEGKNAEFIGEIGGEEKEYIMSGKMIFEDGILKYPVTLKAGWGMKNQILSWLNGEETYDTKGQKVIRFFFKKNGMLQYEKERGSYNPRSVLSDIGSTKNGTDEIVNMFGKKIMDFPKPIALLHYLTLLGTKDDSIVLDFFSGSATTAHAVMQLNAEDNGNRKFILVQLPELCKETSEAYKAGYKNICEIGKERIRRAGEKIKEELKTTSKNQTTLDESANAVKPNELDVGFRVFKLDTSNIIKWQPNDADMENTLKKYENNIDYENRNDLDVVYEIMLKLGLPLTEKIDEITIAGKHVYSVGYNLLLICLDSNITMDVIQEMVKHKPDENLESWRVIFMDNGFASDSVKLNACAVLKAAGLDEDSFITI